MPLNTLCTKIILCFLLWKKPFTRPTLPYQNTIWSHACSLDCLCYLMPDPQTHTDNHATRLPNPPYRNKSLDSSAKINWTSDPVPGMWIFVASRVAMLKQWMKGQGCREMINEGQRWGAHLFNCCTHFCLHSFGWKSVENAYKWERKEWQWESAVAARR